MIEILYIVSQNKCSFETKFYYINFFQKHVVYIKYYNWCESEMLQNNEKVSYMGSR